MRKASISMTWMNSSRFLTVSPNAKKGSKGKPKLWNLVELSLCSQLKKTDSDDKTELAELQKLTNTIFNCQNTLKDTIIAPLMAERREKASGQKLLNCIEDCSSEEEVTVSVRFNARNTWWRTKELSTVYWFKTPKSHSSWVSYPPISRMLGCAVPAKFDFGKHGWVHHVQQKAKQGDARRPAEVDGKMQRWRGQPVSLQK